MDQALRAPTVRIAASLGTLLVLLLALPSASAQLPLEVNGLRGGRHVGSAGELSSDPRAVLGLGYAYTEGVLDGSDAHQRLFSELAAGYAPWRALQLSLGLDARYDTHRGDAGSDSGGAFGTSFSTRHAFAVSRELSMAARTKLRFPAASNVSRGFRGVSPELGAIVSYLVQQRYELSLDLGYRFDRSENSIAQPTALSRADLLAASISRYDAALVGALFSLPLGPVTASAEWSWEVALGSGAPGPLASPMRARIAAQLKLAERYVPGVELGLSPSARPSIDRLARIEPRLWFALSMGVVFERARPPPVDAARPTVEISEAELESAVLDVRVVDPAGSVVSGANVQLESRERREAASTGADGVAALTLTPESTHRLTVSAEGFEPQQTSVEGVRGRQTMTVTMVRHLPEGEIKGSVRSLRGGKPVRAQITVSPLGKTIDTDEKGDFVIGVPPGQYTLEITAVGHEAQQRTATVERLGVTILVVDLRRAPK